MSTASGNRIDTRLAQRRGEGRAALIPFVTAGDPSLESTVPIMNALVAAGADLIELGVPFSDPMADGPVIQQSSERALARGVDLGAVLAMVRDFRRHDGDTPVVLMGYLNPIEIHGLARFSDEARVAGVDGVLLVDCPVEEAAPIDAELQSRGLRRIALVSPTTPLERAGRIAAQASGFLYCVSLAGVTGAGSLRPAEVRERIRELRTVATLPLAVGFGVKDADSAARIAGFADAVVIGSALVQRLAGAQDAAQAAGLACEFLAPIRAAVDAPGVRPA